MKRDDRPQRGCWAPGNYQHRCCDCGEKFMGDKRAMICADCAYGPPKPAQHNWHVVDWLLRRFGRIQVIYPIAEESCPGHVASIKDAKVCGYCGTHIDSLRPDRVDGEP